MMTKYSFCQDEKVTTWRRHWFSVMAESQEQAEQIIRQNGLAKEYIDEVADGQQIIYESSEDLAETQSPMSVDENNGCQTLAVLTADEKREICSNADEPEADDAPDIRQLRQNCRLCCAPSAKPRSKEVITTLPTVRSAAHAGRKFRRRKRKRFLQTPCTVWLLSEK